MAAAATQLIENGCLDHLREHPKFMSITKIRLLLSRILQGCGEFKCGLDNLEEHGCIIMDPPPLFTAAFPFNKLVELVLS
jgi:hypothetical protein